MDWRTPPPSTKPFMAVLLWLLLSDQVALVKLVLSRCESPNGGLLLQVLIQVPPEQPAPVGPKGTGCHCSKLRLPATKWLRVVSLVLLKANHRSSAVSCVALV